MTAKFRFSFKSSSAVKSVIRWFDSDYDIEDMAAGQTAKKRWTGCVLCRLYFRI
jgi:hypothetical protein